MRARNSEDHVTGLAGLLAQHGMSQAKAGRLIGLTPDRMSKTVSGKRRLTANEARDLAAGMGITLDDVLNAVGDAPIALPGQRATATNSGESRSRASMIEYEWPDGHRVIIESTRPFDELTQKRIRGLLDLALTGE